MRFGSVCSGIEAASVAWHPLGWLAAWLSEIEPFPCAVLAHHYPDVPNLGDMTALPEMIRAGLAEAPDVFTGGTPCQAFSVAGKRESLGDARGNLSLTFCEIANAIDDVRAADGREPCVVVWENVPGVLRTTDNAFGCFLGALAGAGCELQPAGERWTNAGFVLGPRRAVAWRTIDAQFFGLAQRRRRVFVVASARDGFDPAAVFLEFDGVRRDSAPSREAGEVAPTIPARSTAGGGLGTDSDCDGGMIRQWPADVACTLNAAFGSKQGLENQHALGGAQLFVPHAAHTLRGEGFDASEDGTGRRTPLVAVGLAQNQRDEVRMMGVAGALAAEPGAKQHTYVAFSCKDHGADAGELAPTLRAMGSTDGRPNGGGQVAIAFHYNAQADQLPGPNTDTSASASASLTCSQQAAVCVAVDCYNHAISGDLAGTLSCTGGPPSSGPCVMQAMQVRRLTPTECERLQGFPDDYTAIPRRGKAADACPDGPRYKALGNSWAVPCARWIGERIDAAIRGVS